MRPCAVALAIVGLLTLAACAPKTYRDQARAFEKEDHEMGQLTPDLVPVPKHERSFSAQADIPLHWAGSSGSKMCVRYNDGEAYWLDGDREEKPTRWFMKKQEGIQFAFAAYDSLSQVPTVFPEYPTDTDAEVVSKTVRESIHRKGDPDQYTQRYLHFVLQWCAPAPTITATTRYIGAIRYSGPDGTPSLYVWQIQGAPAVVSNIAPDVAPSKPPDENRTAAPAHTEAPTGSKNLLAELRAEGRFSAFLAIAAAAGRTDELATAKLTLIAPNNTAVEKRLGSSSAALRAFVADKSRALAFYNLHVIKGVTTRATVEAGAITVTTLAGKTGPLKKDKRLMFDTVPLEDQVIDASNGVIFIATVVIEP